MELTGSHSRTTVTTPSTTDGQFHTENQAVNRLSTARTVATQRAQVWPARLVTDMTNHSTVHRSAQPMTRAA